MQPPVPSSPPPPAAGPPAPSGRRPWYRSWPARAAIGVLVYLVALNTGLVVVALVPGTVGRVEAAAVALVELLAAIAALSVVVRRLEGSTLSRTGLGPERALRHLALGIGVGSALVVLAVGALVAAGAYTLGPGSGTIGDVAVVAGVVAMGALGEEILFRLLLLRTLEAGLGSAAALLTTSVLFGAVHLTNPGATWTGAAAIALTGGLLLGAAFLLTRSVWLALGLHLAVNLAQVAVLGSPVSGRPVTEPALLRSVPTGPERLTGGMFGVEASLPVVLAGLALGLVTALLARRRGRWVPYPPPPAG